MRKHVLTVLLMGVLAFGAGNAAYGFESHNEPDALIPLRGVTSSVPAARWDYGFLTGNGRIGAVVYGQPEAETIVFNHERLYLPQRRPEIPDLGKHLPEVRRLIREEGHVAARDFSIQRAAEQGHFNYHSDPFHLAFELKLEMPAKGAVTNYLRTTDFQTGEVSGGFGMVPVLERVLGIPDQVIAVGDIDLSGIRSTALVGQGGVVDFPNPTVLDQMVASGVPELDGVAIPHGLTVGARQLMGSAEGFPTGRPTTGRGAQLVQPQLAGRGEVTVARAVTGGQQGHPRDRTISLALPRKGNCQSFSNASTFKPMPLSRIDP